MQIFEIGARVTGKCVTMFTDHTGPVLSCTPFAFYSDGTPREYQTIIRSEETGRPVILWAGTERPACSVCGEVGTHRYSEAECSA